MGHPLGVRNKWHRLEQADFSPWFNPGGLIRRNGYVLIVDGNGPGRHVRLHVAIVTRALGHRLPRGAVTHHVNSRRDDNRNDNLCVLQDSVEHNEIHRKMLVRAAGGDPWTDRLCISCGVPKPVAEFYFWPLNRQKYSPQCRPCARVDARERQRSYRQAAMQ